MSIAYIKNIPSDKLHRWLESFIRPALRPDVSNYAKGRPRVWLGIQPNLTPPFISKPAFPLPDKYWNRLAEILGWPFDYCLVTYSGDKDPIGISPHRDAGYADFEAWTINISGQCKFKYWEGRESFDASRSIRSYKILPNQGVFLANEYTAPTHEITLLPGDVLRFNCKDPHSAAPSPGRWNMNFWRKKISSKT